MKKLTSIFAGISICSLLLSGCAMDPPKTMNAYSNYDSVPDKDRGLWLSHQILVLGNQQLLEKYLQPKISIQKTILPILNKTYKQRENDLSKINSLSSKLGMCDSLQQDIISAQNAYERDRRVIAQYQMEGQIIMGLGALACFASSDCIDDLADNIDDSGKSVGSLMKGMSSAFDGIAISMAQKHGGIDLKETQRKMEKAKIAERKMQSCQAEVIEYNNQLDVIEKNSQRNLAKAKQQCMSWFVKLPKEESDFLCESILFSTQTFNKLYK